jgi:glycosyltransferase involved in cell wall biosynthesis
MLGWEFPPFVSGGLGTHCYELTNALAKKGIEIDFFMPLVLNRRNGKNGVKLPSNMRIIEVCETTLMPYISPRTGRLRMDLSQAVWLYNNELVRVVEKLHAERKYDLIHSHDWLTARGALTLRKKLGIPLAATFHSTEYDRTSNPWDFIVNLEREALAGADRIIAVSNRTKEQLVRMGADIGKIRVIYNAVDYTKFEIRNGNGNGPYEHRKKGKKIVLFLGRLSEQKGPVQFLYAAKRVLEKQKNVVFLVAGTGDMLPLLINLTIQLGIMDDVIFLGYISDEDQRRIYAMSDLYVMPSTSEPFGITALEAMSAGVPVIISKTSGVGEIVKSALRVDFWDINGMAQRMLAVLQFEPLTNVMAPMQMQEARLHTWDKAGEQTISVYNELVSMVKARQ